MSKQKPLKVIAGAPDRPLVIGDIEIQCYVLEGERRVLSLRGLTAGIGLNPSGGFRIPQFLASKAIKPFVNKDLTAALNAPPLEFQPPGGGRTAYVYPAEILEHIIDAILEAQQAGALPARYDHVAKRMLVLNRGLRRVGIIGLVDETTGYQEIRARNALVKILEEFVAKEKRPWTRTFPYEFHKEIFRLKGWPMSPDGKSIKGPRVVGRYTNDLVYDRIAPGVVEELCRVNPTLASGKRRDKHHQWFTPHPGLIKLNQHLSAVMALMRAAPNWGAFHRLLERAFPKLNETIPMPFDE